MIHGSTKDILEGGNSIDAIPMTSSTGGQQENSEIDAAKPRRTKAVISTRVRNQKLLSNSYWKNIKRRVKQNVLIGQVVQRHQDNPQGASITTGIGEKKISMKQIHTLLLGRQYKGHGHLPMLIIIHIHHGTCMIHGHIIHIILHHLTQIMQLQIDRH